MTPLETALTRHSTRSYADAAPADVLAEVCRGCASLVPLRAETLEGKRVGTYGVITGRPSYIAAYGPDMLRAGIEGETAVLKLTAMGYDTCWMSGTFNKSLAAEAAGREVVAVIACGHGTGRRSIAQRLMSAAARSRTRLPLSGIIVAGTVPDYLENAVKALRNAPSALNRQPWRLAFNRNGTIDVMSRGDTPAHLLDCGIAIGNFLYVSPGYAVEPCKAEHPGLTGVATLVNKRNGL